MFGYITKVYHSGYGSERDIYLSSCINLILETEKLDIYVVLYNGVSRLVQKSSVTFDEIDPFYKADLTCTNAPGNLNLSLLFIPIWKCALGSLLSCI